MPDTRFNWAVIMDLLDVLEHAGYKRSDDDVHTGRAIALLWDAARIYAGELDEPDAAPAIRLVVRGLAEAEAERAARKGAPATFSPAQYEIVARALADAEAFRRERAEAWCEHCDNHPSGACDRHVGDFDQADEYRQLAAELEQEAAK